MKAKEKIYNEPISNYKEATTNVGRKLMRNKQAIIYTFFDKRYPLQHCLLHKQIG